MECFIYIQSLQSHQIPKIMNELIKVLEEALINSSIVFAIR